MNSTQQTLKLFMAYFLVSASCLCFSMEKDNNHVDKGVQVVSETGAGEVHELNFEGAACKDEDLDKKDEGDKITSPSDAVYMGEFNEFPAMLSVCMKKGKLDYDILHSVLRTEFLDNVYKRADVIEFVLCFLKTFYNEKIKNKILNSKREVFYNDSSSEEITPLNLALKGGYLEIAALLIGAGADLGISEEDNISPIKLLISTKYSKEKDIKLKAELLDIMIKKLEKLPTRQVVNLLNGEVSSL